MIQAAVEREIESVRQRCQVLARECGLDVECAMAGRETDGSFSMTIDHSTMDLSFDILVKISETLGSREIQLGCDMGTSSDRSHDPYIIVRWPSLEDAVLLVQEGRAG